MAGETPENLWHTGLDSDPWHWKDRAAEEKRQNFDVGRKQGVSAVDNAIQQLQREYYITIDGNDRKISATGKFYGWPINRYCRVLNWVPAGWLDSATYWSAEQARELILDEGVAMSDGVTR